MNQFKNFKSNFSQFSCKSIPVKLQKTFLICAHICYKSFTMSQKYLILFFFQFLSKIGDLRRPDASIPGKLQFFYPWDFPFGTNIICVRGALKKLRSSNFPVLKRFMLLKVFKILTIIFWPPPPPSPWRGLAPGGPRHLNSFSDWPSFKIQIC